MNPPKRKQSDHRHSATSLVSRWLRLGDPRSLTDRFLGLRLSYGFLAFAARFLAFD